MITALILVVKRTQEHKKRRLTLPVRDENSGTDGSRGQTARVDPTSWEPKLVNVRSEGFLVPADDQRRPRLIVSDKGSPAISTGLKSLTMNSRTLRTTDAGASTSNSTAPSLYFRE